VQAGDGGLAGAYRSVHGDAREGGSQAKEDEYHDPAVFARLGAVSDGGERWGAARLGV